MPFSKFISFRNLAFNKPLRILLFTNSLILVAGAMLGPIYALYVGRIGGDLLDASLAAFCFAIAAGVTVFVVGNFTDRLKRKEKMVITGYTIMGCGFLLLTLASSVWHLLLIQLIIGFGEAIYNPAFDALYSIHLDKKQEGSEWGAWEGINYISIAIGALVGGLTATYLGFDYLFVVMAGMCFISAVYILNLPKKIL
jgi:MFS family permease